MALGHERLDVYRLAIAYVAWVYEKSATLEGVHRAARDQWLRVAICTSSRGMPKASRWRRRVRGCFHLSRPSTKRVRLAITRSAAFALLT